MPEQIVEYSYYIAEQLHIFSISIKQVFEDHLRKK